MRCFHASPAGRQLHLELGLPLPLEVVHPIVRAQFQLILMGSQY